MKIPFVKMQGAGNDFILVDDRTATFPEHDRAYLEWLGSRRVGVGCDGIILLQCSEVADVRMRFFNPDGEEQDMCGNGARCLARWAFDLGATAARLTIETDAGLVSADVLGNKVRLVLTQPTQARENVEVDEGKSVDFVNTGVPHAVMLVDDVASVNVPKVGTFLRNHTAFAPAGTNANFVQVESDGALSIRTYERGVEAETLACGTGAAASAWVAVQRGWSSFPVVVHCLGGDLEIDFCEQGLTLFGGAEYVFEGEVAYGDRV